MTKGNHKQSDSLAGDDGATSSKREQPLQAVLLADSFTDSFRPLSLDRPRVLTPLNNVPLINYSLDFLFRNGVEEVFVVCTSDAVESYVQKHFLWRHSSAISVVCVKDKSLTNAGDALREMDKRNVIQSDPFILMFGDTITNANLKEVVQMHKNRHKMDSSAIMTILFKSVGENADFYYSPLRETTDDLIVGVDPSLGNRILYYRNSSRDKSIRLPCSFFQSHPILELRTDLLDTGIDLCSPDVLARLADEFDYRELRREFVSNSVAEEEEGLQNKLFAHFLQNNEYAARIYNLDVYANVSKELLKRWCYPIVPDQQHHHHASTFVSSLGESTDDGSLRYRVHRHYVYHECSGNSRLARSSQIGGPTLLGRSCLIGEHVRIQSSVVGHHCRLEASAVVAYSHLWDGVQVEAGATIHYSIVGDGVVVRQGAVVSRGCVLGAGVVIGNGVVIPEFTRLTLKEESDYGGDFEEDAWGCEDDDTEDIGKDVNPQSEEETNFVSRDSAVSDCILLGPGGKGHVWNPLLVNDDDGEDIRSDDESEIMEASQRIFNRAEIRNAQTLGYDRSFYYRQLAIYQREVSDDLSEDEQDLMDTLRSSDLDAYDTGVVTFDDVDQSSTSVSVIVGRQKGVDVVKELKQICLEYESNSRIENLAIELNSFKFSQNATYSDCTTAATLAILEKMNIRQGMSDGKLVSDFKSYLEHWAPLLRKMSIGINEEKAIVVALEKAATCDSEMSDILGTGRTFRFFLQVLHDEEIVSEDAILSWAAERREHAESDSPIGKLFALQPVQDFLEWLAESDESDDEDMNDSYSD